MYRKSKNLNKKAVVTLSDFINSNDKLLTAIGLLSSLVLFAQALPMSLVANSLSFFFLFLDILAWWELWGKFPKNGTGTLSWFETTLSTSLFVIIGYWLIQYRNFLSKLLPLFIFIILINFVSSKIKKHDIFNRLFKTKDKEKGNLRYIVGIIIFITIALLSSKLSTFFQNPLEQLLDVLYVSLK